MSDARAIPCHWLGRQRYATVWEAMRAWAGGSAPDQWWFLEHDPVYTLGQGGKTDGLLAPGSIPVVRSDRGGDVTYHGPGQLVVYPLMQLSGLGIGVRELVRLLEQAVIDLLARRDIVADRRVGAPGVYVEGRKIASLGLRVRRGRCYHGLSLNVDLDLAPFRNIHPCGYAGLDTTRLADLGQITATPRGVAPELAEALARRLSLRPEWEASGVDLTVDA